MITIRACDHVDHRLLVALPPELRDLVMAAEWSIEVAAVGARQGNEVALALHVTPNEAARAIERRTSQPPAGD